MDLIFTIFIFVLPVHYTFAQSPFIFPEASTHEASYSQFNPCADRIIKPLLCNLIPSLNPLTWAQRLYHKTHSAPSDLLTQETFIDHMTNYHELLNDPSINFPSHDPSFMQIPPVVFPDSMGAKSNMRNYMSSHHNLMNESPHMPFADLSISPSVNTGALTHLSPPISMMPPNEWSHGWSHGDKSYGNIAQWTQIGPKVNVLKKFPPTRTFFRRRPLIRIKKWKPVIEHSFKIRHKMVPQKPNPFMATLTKIAHTTMPIVNQQNKFNFMSPKPFVKYYFTTGVPHYANRKPLITTMTTPPSTMTTLPSAMTPTIASTIKEVTAYSGKFGEKIKKIPFTDHPMTFNPMTFKPKSKETIKTTLRPSIISPDITITKDSSDFKPIILVKNPVLLPFHFENHHSPKTGDKESSSIISKEQSNYTETSVTHSVAYNIDNDPNHRITFRFHQRIPIQELNNTDSNYFNDTTDLTESTTNSLESLSTINSLFFEESLESESKEEVLNSTTILDYEFFANSTQFDVSGEPWKDYPLYSSMTPSNFTCKKKHKGFYADIELRCQVYHHCEENYHQRFICPNGTLYDENSYSCDYWFNVNCVDNDVNDLFVSSDNRNEQIIDKRTEISTEPWFEVTLGATITVKDNGENNNLIEDNRKSIINSKVNQTITSVNQIKRLLK